MEPVYVVIILVAVAGLLAFLWVRKPTVPIEDTSLDNGACPSCPAVDCPPGAGNGFSANDYYAQKANAAGLDPAKLSLCQNYWYYDGKFTCIHGIDPNGSCQNTNGVCTTSLSVDGLSPASSCGAPGKMGSVDCQFAAVKWALDNGLDSVACPLLTDS